MPDTDLSFVPTDDLVDEIARRSEGCLVAIERLPTDDRTESELYWRGGLTLCIGMASRMHHRLLGLVGRPDEDD